MLKEYLGLEKVIWLWRGMEGDTEVVNGAPPSLAREALTALQMWQSWALSLPALLLGSDVVSPLCMHVRRHVGHV
jgi:hypothetical protein